MLERPESFARPFVIVLFGFRLLLYVLFLELVSLLPLIQFQIVEPLVIFRFLHGFRFFVFQQVGERLFQFINAHL